MPVEINDKDVEEWQNDASGMMKYYQSQSYSLGESIADLVDNAYDANATEIDVKIGLDPKTEQPYIRILDNGGGISPEDMNNAMKLGGRRQRSETDLGVYGIGMKLSSLSQAHEVTIVSKKRGKMSLRRISAHHIVDSNRNELLKHPTNSAIFSESKEKFDSENWSTMILLEDVHQASRWQELNKSAQMSLGKEVKKVRIHLGLTYHRIIEENKDTTLKLDGKIIHALDPFMPWEKDIDYGTVRNDVIIPTKIDGDLVNVKASMIIIPHEKRMVEGKRCRVISSGYKKKNFMQGLYLYRNKRLIQYGGWQKGMFGENLDPHHSLAKMLIDIPPVQSTWFGLGPTKTNMELNMEFVRQIEIVIGEKRSWGPIQKGKKLKFGEAFLHRYGKEGKKGKQSTINAKITGNPLVIPSSVPAPPGQIPKSRAKTIKPKSIISKITEKENMLILTVDKNDPAYKGLRAQLRMWEP